MQICIRCILQVKKAVRWLEEQNQVSIHKSIMHRTDLQKSGPAFPPQGRGRLFLDCESLGLLAARGRLVGNNIFK